MVTQDDRLAGCRVLVTAQRRAEDFAAALQRHGATVDCVPVMSVLPHVDDTALLAATHDLLARPPHVVVITTAVGLRGWLEAADAADLLDDVLQVIAAARLVVRGPKARGAALAAGLTPDWIAESETHREIRDMLLSEGVGGQRIAVQHHGAGADHLDVDLQVAGADVVSLVSYLWGPPPDAAEVAASVRRTSQRQYDAVTFTSAPAVRAFLDVAREQQVLPPLLDAFSDPTVLVGVVGTTTAEPLRELGVDPLVPERFRLGALVRAIVSELEARRGLCLVTAAGTLRVLGSAAVLDGAVVPLSPTGIALLRRLAQAEGSVVSRDELLTVMPGEATSPHAVEVAIARLRQDLSDAELITTVIKRGYRLDGLRC